MQCLRIAERSQNPDLLLGAHGILAWNLLFLGEFVPARFHAEQSIALYNPQRHRALAYLYGQDFGAASLSCLAYILWHLGYQDQALSRVTQARLLAQELTHPYSLAMTLFHSGKVSRLRRESHFARDYGEACMVLSGEQGFPQFLVLSSLEKSWALSEQGRGHDLIPQMHQFLTDLRATGMKGMISSYIAFLAEVCRKEGRVEEGLTVLAEALVLVNETGEGWDSPELYRLKGQFTLAQESKEQEAENPDPQSPILDPQSEAEACFLKALEVAQKQQAKSWELRSATSLARLWQQQGKKTEAHKLLSDVYNWFTEGFDTTDLQEAKVLVAELND